MQVTRVIRVTIDDNQAHRPGGELPAPLGAEPSPGDAQPRALASGSRATVSLRVSLVLRASLRVLLVIPSLGATLPPPAASPPPQPRPPQTSCKHLTVSSPLAIRAPHEPSRIGV